MLGSSFGTISGSMNRVFDIKSGHDFSRYRNSIQVICFQINDYSRFQVTFQRAVAKFVLNIPNYITKFGILRGNL